MFSQLASLATSLAAAATSPTTLTIVLVHGFMGSSESFHSFGADLKRTAEANVVSYEFSTTGDNDLQVKQFTSWLSNKLNVPAGPVALLGHSMGGLLVADAARAIENSPDHSHLNVTHILAFDSPFFGVHPSAIVSSGTRKVTSKFGGLWDSMQSSKPVVGKESTARSISAATATTTTAAAAPAKSSSASYWGAALGIAAVATVAAAAAYSDTGRSLMKAAHKSVSDHMTFLGPLWSPGNQEERIVWLVSRQTCTKKIKFQCYYLETTVLDKSDPTRSYIRTFISLPPDSVAGADRLFEPIDYNASVNTQGCNDEIDAHMNMFRRNVIGDNVYDDILSRVVSVLGL
ncbi:hypothetical protein BJ741DRAFT_608416 [Chytriomyces cf. hyalinus JEL632]|nr:hypothetical protein BJ741DRAFT_608416 [Chytriomyces cf. hyalinus JEL632]